MLKKLTIICMLAATPSVMQALDAPQTPPRGIAARNEHGLRTNEVCEKRSQTQNAINSILGLWRSITTITMEELSALANYIDQIMETDCFNTVKGASQVRAIRDKIRELCGL